MSQRRRPLSIVVKAAAATAALTILACSLIFLTYQRVQRTLLEQTILQHIEDSLTHVASYALGTLFGAGNWVHLQFQHQQVNQTADVLYSYIVDQDGRIVLGLGGFESSDVGTRRQPWEPSDTEATAVRATPQRLMMRVSKELQALFPSRIELGEPITLLTTPISCYVLGTNCGELRVAVVYDSVKPIIAELRRTLIITSTLLTALLTLATVIIVRYNLHPLVTLSQRLSDRAAGVETGPLGDLENLGARSAETEMLSQSLKRFADAELRASRLHTELEVARSLSTMGSQVAHDVRSPAAAIETVLTTVRDLGDEQRQILMSALGRIAEISNALLQRTRDKDAPALASLAAAAVRAEGAPIHLATLLRSIWSEKRMLYAASPGVLLQLQVAPRTAHLYVTGVAFELSRVLSNLIDNAVQAKLDNRQLTVCIDAAPAEQLTNAVAIRIIDDGRGMPPALVAKLGKERITQGKADGHGLGVVHAFDTARAHGGTLRFESSEEAGTSVALTLPVIEPPSFSLEGLVIGDRDILILDDDPAMHEQWREVLGSFGRRLTCFADPEALTSYLETRMGTVEASPGLPPPLALIDLQLARSSLSGLDLIARCPSQWQRILVTSQVNDPTVQRRVESLGARLLAKAQIPHLELCQGAEEPIAALLDDDPWVRHAWETASKAKGMALITTGDAEEFLARTQDWPRGRPLFVDSYLDDVEVGAEMLERLSRRGHTSIYAASALDDPMPPRPGYRGNVGKVPPTWLFTRRA